MVAIGRKKQQGHQRIQDHAAHRHIGGGAWVIHLVHGHTHLGVDHGPGQLRDIEKEVYRHPQQVPKPHLQRQTHHQLRHPQRFGSLLGGYGRHKHRQHQRHAGAHRSRDVVPAQDRVEQDEPAHTGIDKQEQRQFCPIKHIQLLISEKIS